MRFLIAFVALWLWGCFLCFWVAKGISVSSDTALLSMAIVVAGGLAGNVIDN